MKIYPAKISKRAIAFIIDYFVLSILYGIAMSMNWSISDYPDFVLFAYNFVLILCYLFYLPFAEIVWSGQTLGKMITGIRVVQIDGSPVTGVQSLQRFLMMFFDLGTVVGGLLCANITKNRQRFGDLVASTVVIDDKPQKETYKSLVPIYYTEFSDEERQLYLQLNDPTAPLERNSPAALAKEHRRLELVIARLRTQKCHPALIEHMEAELTSVHTRMFRHRAYTFVDMLTFTLRSIPTAVYQSRICIIASLLISIIAYSLGIYNQHTDLDFFREFLGESYYETTMSNINSGDPMGIYKSSESFPMFCRIFLNNFGVALRTYAMGILTLIGPLFILIQNFVMVGVFDTFFYQQGLLADALIAPNIHGVLELSSIIVVGGASLRLGTGWLFPGRLSRMKAWALGARQSMLILISTIPMILVAALIESFVTRHTEWSLTVRLGIIIVSAIVIIGYYVVLPFLTKDK